MINAHTILILNKINIKPMKGLIILITIFVLLFKLGVKLNRWINGSSKISKNQEKTLDELRKQNKK